MSTIGSSSLDGNSTNGATEFNFFDALRSIISDNEELSEDTPLLKKFKKRSRSLPCAFVKQEIKEEIIVLDEETVPCEQNEPVPLYATLHTDLAEISASDECTSYTTEHESGIHSEMTDATSIAESTRQQPNVTQQSCTTVNQGEDNDDDIDIGTMLTEPRLTVVGGAYYAARDRRRTNVQSWSKVLLSEVYMPETYRSSLFRYEVMDKRTHAIRCVEGDRIAYATPCARERVYRGLRVVAMFKKLDPTGGQVRPGWGTILPGIVLELPTPENMERYLIYFGNGSLRYVRRVHEIVQSRRNFLDYVLESDRSFVETLVEKRQVPCLEVDKLWSLSVDYDGENVCCTVMAIDCSLVLIYRANGNIAEWMHRGSPRLLPNNNY